MDGILDDETSDFLQLLAYIMLVAFVLVVVIKSLGIGTTTNAVGVMGAGVVGVMNISGGKDGKDEYDSVDAIKEIDKEFVYDNMIVDGNNFLHKLYDFENPKAKNPDTSQRFKYLEKSIKILYEELPNRKIFFVLKDPDVHEKDVMEYLKDYKGETIRTKFKSYFKKLLSKYPTVRVVMAYGQAKSRDDFTCIHLANILGKGTVLLSRDRYRDIIDIDSDNTKVNIVVYGKQSATWTKKFKKPFMYADKATVVDSLIGFTFSRDAITLLYKKFTSKHSAASDRVLNIQVKIN